MTGQLDLFNDGRDVMLTNDVIAALHKRDAAVGRRALLILSAEFPGLKAISAMTTLLETLHAPVNRFADHEASALALFVMITRVAPAAQVVLGGGQAREWLAPIWLSMANAAAALPFKAEMPNTHTAHFLLQGGAWEAAEATVSGIASWRRMPVTLAWMAEARFHQSGLEGVWPLLFELAWIDEGTFGALVHHLKAPSLNKLLNEFTAAVDGDEAAARSWFPAWLLIARPAMSGVLGETQLCNNHAPEQAARLVSELLILEKQGRHADLVVQRKRLRDMHASLYAFYMSSR